MDEHMWVAVELWVSVAPGVDVQPYLDELADTVHAACPQGCDPYLSAALDAPAPAWAQH